MPSEVITDKSLQRELADSIIRMVPLDEIRILLACGAKVNCYNYCILLKLLHGTTSGHTNFKRYKSSLNFPSFNTFTKSSALFGFWKRARLARIIKLGATSGPPRTAEEHSKQRKGLGRRKKPLRVILLKSLYQ